MSGAWFGKTLVCFGLAMLMAPAPVAFAQSSGAACSTIADDAQRLACYDKLFRNGGRADDALSVTFESEQQIPAYPSGGRGRAEFTVSCEAGVLSARFSFAGQLLSATGDFAPITFQLDQQSARTRTLNASLDNTALGFWTTADAEAFLSTLEGASALAVRVTPTSYRSLSVRFRLEGVLDAVAPIRAACQE
jgi:hypothetical protein